MIIFLDTMIYLHYQSIEEVDFLGEFDVEALTIIVPRITIRGGEGWKLKDFYTGDGLDKHLSYSNLVDIVTLEGFIANQGNL